MGEEDVGDDWSWLSDFSPDSDTDDDWFPTLSPRRGRSTAHQTTPVSSRGRSTAHQSPVRSCRGRSTAHQPTSVSSRSRSRTLPSSRRLSPVLDPLGSPPSSVRSPAHQPTPVSSRGRSPSLHSSVRSTASQQTSVSSRSRSPARQPTLPSRSLSPVLDPLGSPPSSPSQPTPVSSRGRSTAHQQSPVRSCRIRSTAHQTTPVSSRGRSTAHQQSPVRSCRGRSTAHQQSPVRSSRCRSPVHQPSPLREHRGASSSPVRSAPPTPSSVCAPVYPAHSPRHYSPSEWHEQVQQGPGHMVKITDAVCGRSHFVHRNRLRKAKLRLGRREIALDFAKGGGYGCTCQRRCGEAIPVTFAEELRGRLFAEPTEQAASRVIIGWLCGNLPRGTYARYTVTDGLARYPCCASTFSGVIGVTSLCFQLTFFTMYYIRP